MSDWTIALERSCVSCNGSGLNHSRKNMHRDSCSDCNGYGIERKKLKFEDLILLLKEAVLHKSEEVSQPIAEVKTSTTVPYEIPNNYEDCGY